MAITLHQGQSRSYSLPAGSVINITPSGTSIVENYGRGDELVSRSAVTASYQIGPYISDVKIKITCLTGSVVINDVSQYLTDIDSGSLSVINAQKTLFRKNQLVNTWPTLVAKPYGRSGDAAYSSISAGGGGSIAVDYSKTDPMTGLPMAKCTIPAGSTSYMVINYHETFAPFQMGANDSWFLVCYIPERLTTINVQLLVSDVSVASGTNYRLLTFSGNTTQVQKGWNILQCLQKETRVDSVTYGTIGTTMHSAWTDAGTQTFESGAVSVAARCRVTSAAGADVDIHLGSIHRAPYGWAKAGICWMADDVPYSFYEKAVPIIESYGWKYSLAVTSGYAGSPTEGANVYMSLADVRAARAGGAEVWNHTRLHDNMDTASTENKQISIDASVGFWGGQGFSDASRFLAWPFGAYDDESITMYKAAGGLLARSIHGDAICPAAPGINPYYLNTFSVEQANSWRVDAMIEGNIRRGTGMITYAHTAVAGGTGVDGYPASGSFYVDHLIRWCDRIAEHEAAGRVVVTTPLEYLRLCGIDPYTHKFQE